MQESALRSARFIQLTQIRATVLAPDKWSYGEEGEINARRKTTP